MQVAPGIYSLGDNRGGRVRAFILDDGQGVTIVDTLMAADAQLILDELARLGRAVTDVKHLIQTHAHLARTLFSTLTNTRNPSAGGRVSLVY